MDSKKPLARAIKSHLIHQVSRRWAGVETIAIVVGIGVSIAMAVHHSAILGSTRWASTALVR